MSNLKRKPARGAKRPSKPKGKPKYYIGGGRY